MPVNNILQNVETYQDNVMAWLLNSFCFINRANKKFKDFNSLTANLGETVSWKLPPRGTVTAGLVASFQGSQQRVQSLTCASAMNYAYQFSAQEFIFNVKNDLPNFSMAAAKELGTKVESHIAKSINSTMTYNDPDPDNVLFGQYVPNSGPYRFYGDGEIDLTSYEQLSDALYAFEEIGFSPSGLRGFLPLNKISRIVGTGLNQFAIDRNNRDAMSWMVGEFQGCEWDKSNLMPTHIAGSIGRNSTSSNRVMTVLSTNDPTGQNVTEITVTEPTGSTSIDAINVGDLFQFEDGVSGFQNMRAMTFIGHELTSLPVQMVATAASSSTAGTLTLNIRTNTDTGLVSAATRNQNINQPIQAGMKIRVMPSHKCGLIMSGNPFYLAMPQLPEEDPFTTYSRVDPDSGAAIRTYYGSLFGQNKRGIVNDTMFGASLVPENCQRLLFTI